jgi:hypothetical protein
MRTKLSIAIAAVLFVATGLAGRVMAQTGYPGNATTTSATPTTTVQSTGTLAPGQSKTVEACGFQGNSNVTETLDGNSAGTDSAASNSCATITLTVVSGATALGSSQMLGAIGLADLVAQKAPTVSVNGRGPFAAVVGQNTLVTSGTGANGGPFSVTTVFAVAGSTPSGGLPRTGAMILRWTSVALALIAIGGILFVADRRRGRRSTSAG